jgi:hypothetical protein
MRTNQGHAREAKACAAEQGRVQVVQTTSTSQFNGEQENTDFETARHEDGRNQVNAKAKSCIG